MASRRPLTIGPVSNALVMRLSLTTCRLSSRFLILTLKCPFRWIDMILLMLSWLRVVRMVRFRGLSSLVPGTILMTTCGMSLSQVAWTQIGGNGGWSSCSVALVFACLL